MPSYTNSLFHFDVPNIDTITANFAYFEYDKYEYSRPWPDPSDNNATGYKRYVKLAWNIKQRSWDRYVDVENQTTTNVNIYDEMDVQLGYFSMTPVYEAQWEITQTEVNSTLRKGSFYDLYLRGLKNGMLPDFSTLDDEIGTEVAFDITSGAPIIKKSQERSQAPRGLFSNTYASYLARNLLYSPTSETDKISELVSKLDSISSNNYNSTNYRLVNTEIPEKTNISEYYINTSNPLGDFSGIYGFQIERFNEVGTLENTWISLHDYFIDGTVLYGKNYTYLVKPIVATNGVPILVHNEAKISITTEEVVPPNAPKDFNIQWKNGSSYLCTWTPNFRVVEIDDYNPDTPPISTTTKDVKGYQILKRDRLDAPYELVVQINFSDLELEYREMNRDTRIPNDIIIDLEGDETYSPPHPRSAEISLSPNRDHYVTMCALDSRGQPSGYATQWKIYRNSVTGEIKKELISSAGAPRNQPNLLYRDQLIQDSLKVSNLRHCRVHFNPDLAKSIPDNGQSVDLQFFDTKSDTYQSYKLKISTQ